MRRCWHSPSGKADISRAPDQQLTSLQWIAPLEFGKSRKVTIGRHENAAMLHGERRKVCIRDEVPECLSLFEQCLQHRPVALGGMDQPYARLIEPALHAAHCLIEIQWSLEDAGIGADANERTQHIPGQAHRRGTRQLRIPPGARGLVLRTQLIFRVQDEVRIDEDHRVSSPSTCAKSS